MSGLDRWGELRDRLQRAAATLDDMSAVLDISEERYRHLSAKRSGVLLALSYMADFEPVLSETP
jgi:hypothetical protein